MRERPILFSEPMVRAILEGRKSMTRRVVKPQPQYTKMDEFLRACPAMCACPYGLPGDRLWVRESFYCVDMPHYGDTPCLVYADEYERYQKYDQTKPHGIEERPCGFKFGHHPSIFMPRWASRINLEITGIRVERLQDISEEDAKDEGCSGGVTTESHFGSNKAFESTPLSEFYNLWESINAKRGFGWDKNPWVWVIEFKREAKR